MAIAGMQGLLEAASLGATAQAGSALAADAAGLADVEDWDAPPPSLKEGVHTAFEAPMRGSALLPASLHANHSAGATMLLLCLGTTCNADTRSSRHVHSRSDGCCTL